MKNFSFRKLTLILALMIGNSNSFSQPRTSPSLISSYFQDRISNAQNENELIPFHEHSKLKLNQVENAKLEIWSLWKSANTNRDTLPAASDISFSEVSLHHWNLPDEDPMPFYFIKKNSGAEKNRYPLFINLHGSGPKAMEFKATLELSKRYNDSPSTYFIPQIPNEKRYRWWYQAEQFAWEKLFRLAMLDEKTDPNKIYIMGISEGGYGSQRLGAYYADYLAGAGPMAGGEPLQNAPPLNYRNIAFSFQTGEDDRGFGRNTYTAAARSAFDSLTLLFPGEFVHNIQLQKGRGHAIDYFKTTPWLVQHQRNPGPMHISWVYFPLNGRYRKGFYNITIAESPGLREEDTLNRIFFDIKFDRVNNTIIIYSGLTNGDLSSKQEIEKGSINIYLDDRYVKLNKRVNVIYNGKNVFRGKVNLTRENMVESCAAFGDPYRMFPGKINVRL